MIFYSKGYDSMENKSLLAVAGVAAYLLLRQSNTSICRSDDSTPIINDHYSATVEVLGPRGSYILMPATTVSINKDFTVLSTSLDSFNANQLDFQTGSTGDDTYITSIGGLDQQSSGPLSGWLYKVNDVFIDGSPATYEVTPGDRITWIFTTDLGKDVGAPPVIFERRLQRRCFNNLHSNLILFSSLITN